MKRLQQSIFFLTTTHDPEPFNPIPSQQIFNFSSSTPELDESRSRSCQNHLPLDWFFVKPERFYFYFYFYFYRFLRFHEEVPAFNTTQHPSRFATRRWKGWDGKQPKGSLADHEPDEQSAILNAPQQETASSYQKISFPGKGMNRDHLMLQSYIENGAGRSGQFNSVLTKTSRLGYLTQKFHLQLL